MFSPDQLERMLQALAPEMCLALGALGVLALDMLRPGQVKKIRLLVWATSLLSLAACIQLWWGELPIGLFPRAQSGANPPDSLVVDRLALSLKMLIALLTAMAVWLSEDRFEEESRNAGEYYSLMLFAALGMQVAVSANEFLTFFVAFELFSIPMYVLAAIRRYRSESAEAGLKYFLTGSVSSAMLLYGISWVYGSLGTTYFGELTTRFFLAPQLPNGLLVGVVLILVALGFKIAAAPFHMWAPDVYEGAPTSVAAYLSCAPKAAVVAFCLRLFWVNMNLHNSTLQVTLTDTWMLLFAVMAVLSMTMGNLMALPQLNLKRLLAFSGISQVGFLLMGVAASSTLSSGHQGMGATLFYLWIYCLTNLTAWAVLIAALPAGTSFQRTELAGLARRSPFVAFTLMISLFSLAGVPPLAGFVGKFYLFRAAFSGGLAWLVGLGIANSVISLYYYFRVLRTAYFDPPADPTPLQVHPRVKLVLAIGLAVILLMGLWPGLAAWSLSTVEGLPG